MSDKWEKECWRKTESEIEQIRTTNAFVYDSPKFIPFKDLSLINKIKTIYLHCRYM